MVGWFCVKARPIWQWWRHARWPFWPAARGERPRAPYTHANGMWSSDSAKRRQALYFFGRRPTYIRTRAKMSSRDVATPLCRTCIHAAVPRFILRGCLYVVRWCARGRGRGLAFENAQPVGPVSYLWTELMHLPRYESRGGRLRKTSTLIRLSTFTFVCYRYCYQTARDSTK